MDNGNIDVGKNAATRRPRRLIGESPAEREGPSNPAKVEQPGICGAMSQQSADNGNISAPQKFVQLVGCRDPKARPEPWVVARPAPPKR